MLDKNGRNIKTGDVVRISNAFFKNDNGLYFVENSEGDPSWHGNDHCLKKISKKGKISTAKHNICFWPIMITVSDRDKKYQAKAWNKEHAEIEIVSGIDCAEIVAYFKGMADNLNIAIDRASLQYGKDSYWENYYKTIQAHYLSVAARVLVGA